MQELLQELKISDVKSKTTLSNDTKYKLFAYQRDHTVKLIQSLLEHKIALDTSDPGVGKTYIAAAICKELGKKPVVVCPKTLMIGWANVLRSFGIDDYEIVNYETIINTKMYADDKYSRRKKSTYIETNKYRNGNPDAYFYKWNLSSHHIVIFDEAHRCKEHNTGSGRLLMSTKQLIKAGTPVLLLSATICEKFEDMRIPFILFGFIPSHRNYSEFVRLVCARNPDDINKEDYATSMDYHIAINNYRMTIIHKEIDAYTSRIRIDDLGDMFPNHMWCAKEYAIDKHTNIEATYAKIQKICAKLDNAPSDHTLSKLQKLEQKIEILKVPVFVKLARSYLKRGNSVVIFVNYLDTLHMIAEQLDVKCLIYGEQSLEDRQVSIDKFQDNSEKIIICQMRAGGIGISLHDIHGGHPRIGLLNYAKSAKDLLQALGRVCRAGGMTPVKQYIIMARDVPHERKIMENINKNLANISAINDGTSDGYKFDVYADTI